jgi:hypothetical protein
VKRALLSQKEIFEENIGDVVTEMDLNKRNIKQGVDITGVIP